MGIGGKVGALERKVIRLSCRIPVFKYTLRKTRSKSVAIVMYHGVSAQSLPVFNWCQMALPVLDEQLRFLSHEYQVCRLPEIAARIRSRQPLPERAAVITFDDGYRSVYTTALPLLQRYGLPFTVFVTTGMVGRDELIWTDRLFCALLGTAAKVIDFANTQLPLARPAQCSAAYYAIGTRLKRMEVTRKDLLLEQLIAKLKPSHDFDSIFRVLNWEEIQRLSCSGLADFGSHSHSHPILSFCDSQRQRWELKESRDILSEHVEFSRIFAYPNGGHGDYNEVTKSLLKELGYRGALTTIPGVNHHDSDVYELRRVNIGANTTLGEFEQLMMGL